MFYVASAAKDLGEGDRAPWPLLPDRKRSHPGTTAPREGGGDLVIDVHVVGIQRFLAAQNAELAVVVILKCLREITGLNVHPAKITLVHMRNSDSPEFERFCGCPVEFGGATDQLVFTSESALRRFPITRDMHLLDVLRPICDEAAKQRETAPASLRASVEIEAQKLLPHCRAQRHNIAKTLAMSTRTLARRLASEGHNLRGVRCRRVAAEPRPSIHQDIRPYRFQAAGCLVARLRKDRPRSNHAFARWTEPGRRPRSRNEKQLPAPA